jgi:hypothetical protein
MPAIEEKDSRFSRKAPKHRISGKLKKKHQLFLVTEICNGYKQDNMQ